VRTTIQKGWTNKEGVEGDARLKFTEFKLLHDVMDDLCKKVTIKIPVEDIHEESIQSFDTLFKEHKGKKSLRFVIYDVQEEIELEVPSRNTKIKISSELLKKLEDQHVNFKLN
jgi:DNA polymerase-3 subunit alpha